MAFKIQNKTGLNKRISLVGRSGFNPSITGSANPTHVIMSDNIVMCLSPFASELPISCTGATNRARFTNGGGTWNIEINGILYESPTGWGLSYFVSQTPALAALLYILDDGYCVIRSKVTDDEYLRVKLIRKDEELWEISESNENPTVSIDDNGNISFCLAPAVPELTCEGKPNSFTIIPQNLGNYSANWKISVLGNIVDTNPPDGYFNDPAVALRNIFYANGYGLGEAGLIATYNEDGSITCTNVSGNCLPVKYQSYGAVWFDDVLGYTLTDTSMKVKVLSSESNSLNIGVYNRPSSVAPPALTIEWGDGNTDILGDYDNIYHTYDHIPEDGYIVKISGSCQAPISVNGSTLTEVITYGDLGLTGIIHVNSVNLISVPDSIPSTITTFSVDNYTSVFSGCTSFNDPNVSLWDVSNVTNMNYAFNRCGFNRSLNTWNTSNVISMRYMFKDNIAFNQDIGMWNTSKVTDMVGVFSGCLGYSGSTLNWNTSNVTDMSEMFSNCLQFNGDISTWDTSKVTSMNQMFYYCSQFNSDIPNWKVGNVNNMNIMFAYASNFNRDLSNWCVSKITTAPDNFRYGNYILPNEYLPVWGTCPAPIVEPVPTYQLNFTQGFTDNIDGQLWTNMGEATIVDNPLGQKAILTNGHQWAMRAVNLTGNFELSFDVYFPDLNMGNYTLPIMEYGQDGGDNVGRAGFAISVLGNGDGSTLVLRNPGYQVTTLINQNQMYRIKLVGKGYEVKLYINDGLIGSYQSEVHKLDGERILMMGNNGANWYAPKNYYLGNIKVFCNTDAQYIWSVGSNGAVVNDPLEQAEADQLCKFQVGNSGWWGDTYAVKESATVWRCSGTGAPDHALTYIDRYNNTINGKFRNSEVYAAIGIDATDADSAKAAVRAWFDTLVGEDSRIVTYATYNNLSDINQINVFWKYAGEAENSRVVPFVKI